MENKVTIKIPRELYKRLSRMIEDTGFSSVTEFIVFVMRTLAWDGEVGSEDRLTAQEVRAIRERLRRLGYLKEEVSKRAGFLPWHGTLGAFRLSHSEDVLQKAG